jgi:hypothetical protein
MTSWLSCANSSDVQCTSYVDSADELSMPIAVLVAGNGQLRLEVLEGGLKLTVGATTLWFWRSRFVRFRTVFLIDEPIEDWFEVHLTEAVVVYLARRPPTKAIARFAIFSS